LHDEKEPYPRHSTDAGIQIDCNDEQSERAHDSIRVSFDPDSNDNEQSDPQQENENSPRNAIEAGREIDFNDG
jgi:hypothetical protein